MSMDAGLLPHQPPVDDPDHETRVVRLGTEEAAALCRSLGSETATNILASLSENPTTASTVADRVDTSLQNAHYHIERLEEAGLVDVVDTWYSSRGVEMNVYAAVYDEFVIAPVPDDDPTERESATNAAERGATASPDDASGSDGDTEPSLVVPRP